MTARCHANINNNNNDNHNNNDSNNDNNDNNNSNSNNNNTSNHYPRVLRPCKECCQIKVSTKCMLHPERSSSMPVSFWDGGNLARRHIHGHASL